MKVAFKSYYQEVIRFSQCISYRDGVQKTFTKTGKFEMGIRSKVIWLLDFKNKFNFDVLFFM